MMPYMTKICGLLSMIFVLTIFAEAQTGSNIILYGNNKVIGNYITIDGAKPYF